MDSHFGTSPAGRHFGKSPAGKQAGTSPAGQDTSPPGRQAASLRPAARLPHVLTTDDSDDMRRSQLQELLPLPTTLHDTLLV